MAAKLREAQKQIKRLEQDMQKQRKQQELQPEKVQQVVDLSDEQGDCPDMLVDDGKNFDEGQARARIHELEKQLDMAKGVGEHWDVLRTAIRTEKDELQQRVHAHKPASAQMFHINRQLFQESQRISKAKLAIHKQEQHIQELQKQLQSAQKDLAEREAKHEELRLRQLELAQAAVQPPDGAARAHPQDAPITALGLDCTALGRILKQLGAGEAAEPMAEEIAKQLPTLVTGATMAERYMVDLVQVVCMFLCLRNQLLPRRLSVKQMLRCYVNISTQWAF
ncbi:unnamed protein product, partial [Prorocentrum cordatum]